MRAPVRKLDALFDDAPGGWHRVGTFAHQRGDGRAPMITAYSRDFNETWAGCVVYQVLAADAKRARTAAMKHRRDNPEPWGDTA